MNIRNKISKKNNNKKWFIESYISKYTIFQLIFKEKLLFLNYVMSCVARSAVMLKVNVVQINTT